MKRLPAVIVTVLAVGGVATSAGASWWPSCIDPLNRGDFDLSIKGCTKIVSAVAETRKNIARAYAVRGLAFIGNADF